VRFWELATRYAGAVFVATALVLILPDGTAQRLGLESLRTEYKGHLSLGLILSGAVIAGSLVHGCWPLIRRLAVSPFMKLAFPVKDEKTGVRQSRMRYYLVRLSSRNGKHRSAYMELDSNGNKVRYADHQGKTVVPHASEEESMLNDGAFQFPRWGRVDWTDVFNGQRESGRWGIRSR